MIVRLKRKTYSTWSKDERGTWSYKPDHREIKFLPKEEKKESSWFFSRKKEEPIQSTKEEVESNNNNYKDEDYYRRRSEQYDEEDNDYSNVFNSDAGEDDLGSFKDSGNDLVNWDPDKE